MNPPTIPKVGDVKSRVGGQTNFYTSRDIAAMTGAPAPARRNTTVTPPPPTPLTTPDGAVEATALQNGGTPTLPEPVAPTVQEGFQAGLEASITGAKDNLNNTLVTERDAALKRQEALNKQLQDLMKNSDPTQRDTFQQEQRIIQNQLNASETASASLEEDFNKRRSVITELEGLLTQGNQAIETARRQPVSMAVLNKSVATTAQMVQARAGVLSAVVAGLDGNINAAHSIINNASNAVAAVWQDQLAYNQAYMNLVNNGELAKNKIHDEYANSQIVLAERSLAQLEKTKEHINKLMIDPESAQFMADAGITLNDSVAEINAKMAGQAKRQEREATKNELLLEGYEYVAFPGDRTDVVTLDIGGQQMSFVPPPSVLQDQASKAGEGVGGVPSRFNVKFSASQVSTLQGAGFAPQDVAAIEQSINEFGIEATLAGIEDSGQRLAVAQLLKAEAALSNVEAVPLSVEETITSMVNIVSKEQLKKLKTMADAAGVSSFWTGKKTDVKRLLNTPEMQTVIQGGLDRGLTTEEILEALVS
jgi:hypothetical protein